ncbi:hypothetical protein, partial [Micromonospora sp. NBS 11-29]|uniref:hypothetical protein n=1 Tax=Micromonospora sp. NBS 11-29 TaxID=1960879 RepID=UPI00159425CB
RRETAARLRAAASGAPGVAPGGQADGGPVAGVLALLAPEAETALATVQAFTDSGVAGRLWWLTRGAAAVGAADAPVDPVAAGIWGLGRVAGLEEPGRWGGLVDLPAVVDAQSVRRV